MKEPIKFTVIDLKAINAYKQVIESHYVVLSDYRFIKGRRPRKNELISDCDRGRQWAMTEMREIRRGKLPFEAGKEYLGWLGSNGRPEITLEVQGNVVLRRYIISYGQDAMFKGWDISDAPMRRIIVEKFKKKRRKQN